MLVRELILYGALYSATNKDHKAPADLTKVSFSQFLTHHSIWQRQSFFFRAGWRSTRRDQTGRKGWDWSWSLPTNQITQRSQHIRWRLVRLALTWLWKCQWNFVTMATKCKVSTAITRMFFFNLYCDQVIFNLYYNNLSITFDYLVIFIHHFGTDVLLLIQHTVVGNFLCSQPCLWLYHMQERLTEGEQCTHDYPNISPLVRPGINAYINR